ncbi:MAG: cytochrome c biogenesis protein CcmG/thiol:disulfide interchange protein DsbE [Saprospiraceae bacterium]|jgi:cytochrome c biogenesis protein CcmG/thiol:disulfide interchange protein DsbE
MKIIKLFTAALCLLLTTSVFAQKEVPDLDLKTLDGKTINLQDFAKDGNITLVSFWATWCSPCKKELDAISYLYPTWQADYGVELLAITIDTRRALAKVPGIVETKGWEYTVLSANEQEAQNAFSFQTIPQTFLIDQNGKIVWDHSGYLPGDEDELEEVIAKLAKK